MKGDSAQATLKLLSLNIQVGISNSSFSHYLSTLWQHILPSAQRGKTLTRVSELIDSFDLIALQEVDSGSFRTGFHDQVRAIALQTNLKYWHTQTNRDWGVFAQHSNAVLTRVPIVKVSEHQLPGLIPGRGAIEIDVEFQGKIISVFIAHLSLGKRSQRKQLAYLAKQINKQPHPVLMGDFNASGDWLINQSPLKDTKLAKQDAGHTYPAWQPKRDLDHIFVSETLVVSNYQVLDQQLSDHLPVSLEISFKPSN